MLQRVRVVDIRRETADIISLELVSADGGPLANYTPGAHIDVHVKPGLIRQYSLYEPPGSTSYFIAVKREAQSRGGSAGIHSSVNPGHVLTISTPRNNFALAANASHSILLAGGIGVTPIASMAGHLRNIGGSYAIHYFARSAKDAALLARLERDHSERLHTHYLDPADVSARLGEVIPTHQTGLHVYLCGPTAFMNLVQEKMPNWPADGVHIEHFVNDALGYGVAAGAFTVELARSGQSFVVGPNESIVEVLASHGIDVPTSCEQGVCGTCLTKVLEGRLDHRDVYMTDEEHAAGDQITPCVSRCLDEKLVLDL
jgi:vanillate O-demethylase ferredoxin subunit